MPALFVPIDWQFRLGRIYFNTAGEPDDLGCIWTMPTPDGWESPTFRGSSAPIPFADGADISDAYDGERTIHGVGEVEAPTSALLERAKSRLLRETRLMRSDGQFFGRYESGPDRYCTVRRGGTPAFPTRYAPQASAFDFMLIAGDPYKYATTPEVVIVRSATAVGGLTFPLTFPLTFSTPVDVSASSPTSHNYGDLDAPIVFRFIGPLKNPTLIDRLSGHRLALTREIPLGETVIVSTHDQTVEVDGDSVYTSLDTITSTDFSLFTVPAIDDFEQPGQCQWLLYGQGAGTVEVVVQSTWE